MPQAQDNIIELNKSRLRALEELKAARQKIAELGKCPWFNYSTCARGQPGVFFSHGCCWWGVHSSREGEPAPLTVCMFHVFQLWGR